MPQASIDEVPRKPRNFDDVNLSEGLLVSMQCIMGTNATERRTTSQIDPVESTRVLDFKVWRCSFLMTS